MTEDSLSLHCELDKLRLLFNAADGNPGLQRALAETMCKLTKEIDRHAMVNGRVLGRPAVDRAAMGIVSIVCEELQGIKNYELIIDKIVARLPEIDVENTPAEIKLITQQK
jgi:hypothetical protein